MITIHEPTDVTVKFSPTTCAACGCHFALDAAFEKRRRKDGQTFYCPAGHTLYFSKSDDDERAAAQLRKELEAAKSEAAAARTFSDFLNGQLRETEKQLTVTKRKATRAKNDLTKVKTRIAAGVCPDCNRTFQNVAAHMATKHPKK